MFGNKSVYLLTIVWNEKHFLESKSARYAARRCVYRAANGTYTMNDHHLVNVDEF